IGEENRRMTLVRTGTLLERVKRLNFMENTTIQPYNSLLPIPQTEINLNKDATLTQNPGY
ncbi:MAG: SusD family protein, partial [Mucilaginibacter sp.]|nr:SusD family protein [Mucilaginibacter sp.]